MHENLLYRQEKIPEAQAAMLMALSTASVNLKFKESGALLVPTLLVLAGRTHLFTEVHLAVFHRL